MKLEGKTYDQLKTEIQNFLEHPPMIALPGGSWCHFCQQELCRNRRHRDPQLLLIALNHTIRELAEERTKK